MAGYKLINLKNVDLIPGEDPVTVPGIYDAIEGTKKVTMFTNFKIDGVDAPDRFINLGLNGTTYEGLTGFINDNNSLKIEIGEDDAVQISTI